MDKKRGNLGMLIPTIVMGVLAFILHFTPKGFIHQMTVNFIFEISNGSNSY